MGTKRYSMDFEPILLEKDTARLFGTGLPEEGLNVECISVGALPEYGKDFGALTAGTADGEQTDTNLEMNTLELAQYRMRVVTDMSVKLSHPGSVTQWKTKAQSFYLPQFPVDGPSSLQDFFFAASEFFVFEDNIPQFELYSVRAQNEAIILFSGWRFKFRVLKDGQQGRIDLWTSEWPTNSTSPRYPR